MFNSGCNEGFRETKLTVSLEASALFYLYILCISKEENDHHFGKAKYPANLANLLLFQQRVF